MIARATSTIMDVVTDARLIRRVVPITKDGNVWLLAECYAQHGWDQMCFWNMVLSTALATSYLKAPEYRKALARNPIVPGEYTFKHVK